MGRICSCENLDRFKLLYWLCVEKLVLQTGSGFMWLGFDLHMRHIQ